MKVNQDLIFGIFIVSASLALYSVTLNFPDVPAFFPQKILILTGVLGSILAVGSLRKKEQTVIKVPLKPFIVVMLSFFYVFSIGKVGYMASTALYAFLVMLILGYRKPLAIVTISFGTALVIFLLFTKVLAVPLPKLGSGLF